MRQKTRSNRVSSQQRVMIQGRLLPQRKGSSWELPRTNRTAGSGGSEVPDELLQGVLAS